MSENDPKTQVEKAPICVDKYEGVAREPGSWKEVGARLNNRLKTITEKAAALCETAVDSAAEWLQGWGKLPGATAKRIAGERDKADKAEATAQESAALSETELGRRATPNDEEDDPAIETLECKLAQLRAQGYVAALVESGDGGYVLKIVRPEHAEDATNAGLLALQNKPRRATGLTPRQLEIQKLVRKGLSAEKIAGRLGIQQATVESHIRAIKRWQRGERRRREQQARQARRKDPSE